MRPLGLLNRSSKAMKAYTNSVLSIAILNLPIFSFITPKAKLGTLDSPSNKISFVLLKDIMLVHLSICLQKPLIAINTVIKVIFGQSASYFTKC